MHKYFVGWGRGEKCLRAVDVGEYFIEYLQDKIRNSIEKSEMCYVPIIKIAFT